MKALEDVRPGATRGRQRECQRRKHEGRHGRVLHPSERKKASITPRKEFQDKARRGSERDNAHVKLFGIGRRSTEKKRRRMLDEPRNTQQAEDSCAKHGVQVNALSPPPAMASPSTMGGKNGPQQSANSTLRRRGNKRTTPTGFRQNKS